MRGSLGHPGCRGCGAFLSLIDALADYEKLPRPSPTAKRRLARDCSGSKKKFETLLAFSGGAAGGYAGFFVTYSSFLARPTIFLEDLFVLPEHRGMGTGLRLFRAVLSHELTHAIVHSKSRGNCPRWLQEGLAQRFEPRRLSPADLRGVQKLLERQDPASWDAETFSYPAALSLTLHLESLRGFEGLIQVLERLGEGAEVDAALELIYGEAYSSLCERWAEAVLAEAAR